MNPVILLLIITVGTSIFGFQNRQLTMNLIMSPYAVIRKGQWYRVITHAFIHADWMHLIFNMIALWSFGVAVLQYFSYFTAIPDVHFYIMYFAGIIISSIPDLIKRRNNQEYMSLGASGAVSAVIFSAIFFDPWSMVYVFIIPCPGFIFGVVYLIYSSYMAKRGGDHINHDAHFYGSVFGLVYPLLIEPTLLQDFIGRLIHPHF